MPQSGQRQPSVRDVAERAGVSMKTVSNVLNERPIVKPATRERVQEAIRELGYRRSAAGRQLRYGRSFILALAVPELTTPYFAALAQATLRAAETRGYTVLLYETMAAVERELAAASGFETQFADAVILNPITIDGRNVPQTRPLPLVLLGQRAAESTVDHVVIDNHASGSEATEHLLSRGCTRVAFIGSSKNRQFGAGWLRLLGYLTALDAHDKAIDQRLTLNVERYNRRCGALAARELIDSGVEFDGLVCASDLLAIGAMSALREEGLAVPNDVAVIGWDNSDEGAYANPALSTVSPNVECIGQHAVDLAIRRIEAPDIDVGEVVVPHVLIARRSSDRQR